MPTILDSLALPLFVPADRPERYGKAFAAGADAVIVDLEDAVAPADKDAARGALAAASADLARAACPVLLRINARTTAFYEADLAVARQVPLAGLMLAKAEAATDVADLAARSGRPVLALIESARGLAAARDIAASGARLAFGSIDLAADLGCAHIWDALLGARTELVLASRLAGLAGPIDGVTTAVKDAGATEHDMRRAASLGMAGKLLIHPAQIGPARIGLRPTADELAWAERVLAAGDGAAAAVDGAMVDAPVRLRAEQIRRRWAAVTAAERA